jgi:MoxR-like ATPase
MAKKAIAIAKHDDAVKFGRVTAKKFADPQHEDFVPEAEPYNDANGYAEMVALAWEMGEDVLLTGPTGVGKTALIRHMCHVTNRAYRRLPCAEATDAAALIGKPWLTTSDEGVQEMVFQRGMVYDAALYGWVMLLDEANLMHPDVSMVINPLFRVDEGMLIVQENEGEIVPRHEDFRLVATANSLDYAGTKEWNKAWLSRFGCVIEMDYLPRDVEVELLVQQTGVKEAVANKAIDSIIAVREAHADGQRVRFPISFREARNWMNFALHVGLENAAQVTILSKCEPEDVEAVTTMIRAPFTDAEWAQDVA